MFEAIHSSRTLPNLRTAIVSATVRFRALTIIGESSVSGSTSSSDDLGWPSPTYWDGDLTIHTKRLRLRIARRALSPDCTLWVAGTHHIIFSLGFALQRSEPRQ